MLPNAVTGAGAAQTPEPTQRTRDAELGREDFLRMLVAQLEHQDPLQPQDPTEFTAQLAQFSSLEQLIAIRQGIGDAAEDPAGGVLQAAVLLGREVLVETDQIELPKPVPGEPAAASAPLELHLPSAVTSVTVDILDSAGRVVRTLDVGAQEAGFVSFPWDGKNGAGAPLPPGVYGVRAQAGVDGEPAPVTMLVRGSVSRVTPQRAGYPASVTIGELSLPLSAVVEIREAQKQP
jgi:flagellar basal-body rod modification protein FlgD